LVDLFESQFFYKFFYKFAIHSAQGT
jgi:hypothetical protein